MGRVSVELYRQFYTDGAYTETPIGSGYYTLGTSVETPAGSGLYNPSPLTESPLGSGLYEIPLSGRMRRTTNIEQYTVQEDATTLNPSNFFGGAGQGNLTLAPAQGDREFMTSMLTLDDSQNGKFQGPVRAMEMADRSLQVTSDSVLGLLNADRQVAPQRTTLQNAFSYYFGLLDIAGRLYVHPSIATRQITYPGWNGNMWDHIKQILVAEQIEVAAVGDRIMVRPPRSQVLRADRYTQSGWSLNNQNTSKKVRIHYYKNQYGTQREVYPVPPTPVMRADRDDAPVPSEPQIYNVDANETLVVVVDLNASLMSVNQPDCVDFVQNRSYAGTNGVYAVSGSDGKPIPAAQWKAQGGSLSVRLLETSNQIEVTIKGAYNTTLAPYRIAMTAGTGSYYNSLHITGTGVVTEDRYVDLHTGTTAATTGDEIGTEVTNPFIDSLSKAYFVGGRAAAAYALEASSTGVGHRLLTAVDPMGNTAGARLLVDDAYYRVDSATISPESTSINASLDTLISDINKKFAGKTMGQMSTLWQGRTMLDFSLAPLKGE